ncbi:MAG TPA: Type 1 glutamine amidotransferase-like domain-containing protein, partial [Planctomycetota bacterium]|nr:Type 1 glutamine amidotransferase-like domain-containing protein [Planctomycetota bacterium]
MAILPLPVAVVAFASALAAQQPLDPAGVAGTRLICGGGELPAEVMARFVELAGGDAAKIVVIPTASQTADEPGQEAKTRAHWQEQYHREVTVLHTRDRAVADRDDFVAPLRTAAGVWLGGGVQSRIADSYLGTRVETELLALLHRGGVV